MTDIVERLTSEPYTGEYVLDRWKREREEAAAEIVRLRGLLPAEALQAGVEANERIAKLMHCLEESATAEGRWHHRAQVAESALRQIAEHPEKSDDGQRSYAVGWAFWNVQNIAKAVLREASLSSAPAQEDKS